MFAGAEEELRNDRGRQARAEADGGVDTVYAFDEGPGQPGEGRGSVRGVAAAKLMAQQAAGGREDRAKATRSDQPVQEKEPEDMTEEELEVISNCMWEVLKTLKLYEGGQVPTYRALRETVCNNLQRNLTGRNWRRWFREQVQTQLAHIEEMHRQQTGDDGNGEEEWYDYQRN